MLHSIALSAQLHKKIAERLLVHAASRLSDELGSETQMLSSEIAHLSLHLAKCRAGVRL